MIAWTPPRCCPSSESGHLRRRADDPPITDQVRRPWCVGVSDDYAASTPPGLVLTACCQTGCEQFVSTTPVGPVDDRSEPAGRIVPRPRIFAADIKGRAGLADLLATRSAADLVRLALAVEPGVPLVPTDDAARMLHGHPLDGSALDPSFRPGLRGATHVLRCRRETARSVARTRETPARRESAALIVGSLDRVQIHRCLANTADH
jgi:hypothetical protein